MNKSIFTLACLLFYLILGVNSQAQTAYSTASNSAVLQGNTYQYTIGEMPLISTESNTHLIITQGYLQPQSGKKMTSGSDISQLQLITIYPNPTDDVLHVTLPMEMSVNYQLFDVAGKVLLSQTVTKNNRFSLSLSAFATGTYYLIIASASQPNSEKYTCKIQKK